MKSNVTFSTLLVALLSTSLMSTPSFADRDGDRDSDRDGYSDSRDDRDGDRSYGRSTKTKLKARLFSTVQAGARGEVELESKSTKQEFDAEVKLPLPSLSLNIPDVAAASAASVTLSLANAGGVYATCDLDYKVERYSSTRKAEFKVDLASYRGAAPVSRYGNCVDTNGALVIPAVQAADTVAIEVDTFSGPFLTGTFALGR